MFEQAQAGLLPNSVALQMPAWELNLALDSDEWREGRIAAMGHESFKQEHGAEFTVPRGRFFGDLDGLELEDEECGPGGAEWSWVAGLDPATVNDRFGFALVGESRLRPGLLELGPCGALAPIGRSNRSLESRRLHEDETLAPIAEILEEYWPWKVYTDVHLGREISAYLGRRGMNVEIVAGAGPTTTRAFMSLRARLTDGSLRLWRCPQLLEDLRRVSIGDREQVRLPRYAGGHCDAASALSLAAMHFAPQAHPVAAVESVVVGGFGGPDWDDPIDWSGSSIGQQWATTTMLRCRALR